jgi:AcrR family transcriptional regulator
MKTKEKIIKESLNLFNENTFELSTTNLISKKSDVLEGSLWYHFNSKFDLVSVHTKLFLDSFTKRKIYSEKGTPQDLIESLFSVYEAVWDYRYLMRDSFGQTVDTHTDLYKIINEINSSVDVWAKETIVRAKNIGILTIEDKDIDNIVEISLMIGRYWLDYSMKKYPSKSNLYLRKKGINLVIQTLYPYLSHDSKEVMDSIYESN